MLTEFAVNTYIRYIESVGMQDSNMFTDEDISKLKSQKRKLLPQMTSVSQQPPPNEAGLEVTVIASKMPKAFKRSQKNENPQKRLENTKSPQDGPCESSPLTKSGNEYRALRRKYLLLEEEGFSLGKELEHIEADVKKLEEEKLALLDQLVVLEGLVEPPSFQSPGHKS